MIAYRFEDKLGEGCYQNTMWQLGEHDADHGRPCPSRDEPKHWIENDECCAFVDFTQLFTWFNDFREIINMDNEGYKLWIVNINPRVIQDKQMIGELPYGEDRDYRLERIPLDVIEGLFNEH